MLPAITKIAGTLFAADKVSDAVSNDNAQDTNPISRAANDNIVSSSKGSVVSPNKNHNFQYSNASSVIDTITKKGVEIDDKNNKSIIEVLKRIDANTKDTSDDLETFIKSFGLSSIDRLRALERDLEAGNDNIAGMGNSHSSMDQRGSKDNGFMDLVKAAGLVSAAMLPNLINQLDPFSEDGQEKVQELSKPFWDSMITNAKKMDSVLEGSIGKIPFPDKVLDISKGLMDSVIKGVTGAENWVFGDVTTRKKGEPIPSVNKVKPGNTTINRNDSSKLLQLSEEDVINIAKTVQVEWAPNAGEQQARAIIDTILNRTAGKGYGKSATDVVNAKSQFTGVNGRDAHEKGIYSTDDIKLNPRSLEVTKEWLYQRSQGAESTVGKHVNYANIKYSDRVNQRGWIHDMQKMGDTIEFGSGNLKHVHGTPPKARKSMPGEYQIMLPGQTVNAHNLQPRLKPDQITNPIVNAINESNRGLAQFIKELKLSSGSESGSKVKSGSEAPMRSNRTHSSSANAPVTVNNNSSVVCNVNKGPAFAKGQKNKWWDDSWFNR